MLLPSKLHKLILWWGNWEKFVALSITLLWQALPELPFTGEHNWAELSEHCESRQLRSIERCPPYPDEHDCPPALPASAGQADPPCPLSLSVWHNAAGDGGESHQKWFAPRAPSYQHLTVSAHTIASPAVWAPLSSAAPPSLTPFQVTTSTAEQETRQYRC